MDAAGPLSRSVRDSALILSIIAGRDDRDPTTSRRPVPDYPSVLTGDVAGLRLGIVRELARGPETDGEVRTAVETAAARLAALGATIEEVSLPMIPLAGAAFMALADSEGAGLHARWLRERPGDYDAGTRRRLLSAGLLPAALVHQASRARALIRRQVLDALRAHDALLAPMAHTAAPPISAGRAPITSPADVGPRFFTRRCYGSPASLAGVPALSVPSGFTGAGLPIGLQVIGRPFDETTILRVAHAYEQTTEWHRRRPPV
jgi:aspartyl-tRNA(Asn)/glutamyl-tRNA(Gln) amidotransferase subunit A